MLQLQSISLVQFRNYVQSDFSVTERVIALCGKNGMGKTNFLDAIYYLSFTKSYFSRPESLSVHQGLQGMRIEGDYLLNDKKINLRCIVRENNRKEFYFNEDEYKRFSEHLGKIPCVMIAPDDVALITGNSEERRKFIDTILSQCKADYLQWLIDYNKILQQRNSLLKAAAEHNRLDESLLETLDEQLSEKGQLIFEARNKFLSDFIPSIKKQYQYIAQKDDAISIEYDSQLFTVSLKTLLQSNQQRDLYLQRTGYGIHKDDINFLMKDQSFKTLASQGQRKSLLFALKLAEFEVLKQQKHITPILLLDDVFEKLDADRMHHLLYKVCVEENGQIFITDTNKERLAESLKEIKVPFQLIEL
jgi:DNA replication and repair protein RecF